MTRTSAPPDTPSQIADRALVFATLAGMLGPDTSHVSDPATLAQLRSLLASAGAPRCLDVLEPSGTGGAGAPPTDPDALAGRWIRWFEHGRIAPYEGSHVLGNAGGVTPRLADVAGFYRAFGVQVRTDRPDHVVAELEFMALALAREAAVIERGDHEAATVVGDAVRTFLRDHLGTWLDAWAARVGAEPDLAPWAPIAAVAAMFVAAEARRRNVVPLRTATVLVDHVDPLADDQAEVPVCGDDHVDPLLP